MTNPPDMSEVNQRLCAFVDVLGFRSKLADWDLALAYYDEMDRLISGVTEWLQAMTENFERAIPQLQRSNLECFVFSDSLIMTATKASTLIFACHHLQFNGLRRGYYFRGAISCGEHVHSTRPGKILMVSRALSNAYELESNHAKVPRIILDPKCLKWFQRDAGITLQPALLAQGPDNFWFVNYFHGWLEGWEEAVAQVQRALDSNSPADVYQKHLWVAQFFKFYLDTMRPSVKWLPEPVQLPSGVVPERFVIHPYEGQELRSLLRTFDENVRRFAMPPNSAMEPPVPQGQ